VLDSRPPGERALLLGADDPDALDAVVLRQLKQRYPDAAARAVGDDAARPGHPGLVEERAGELVIREAHGVVRRDSLGEWEHGLRRNADRFRVAAAAEGEFPRAHEDWLPGAHAARAGAEGIHDPRHLVAGHGGERRHPAVYALAHEHVRAADSDGPRANAHLARCRLRQRLLHDLEYFRSSRLLHLDDFHVAYYRPWEEGI
jgi:hypothetical protein